MSRTTKCCGRCREELPVAAFSRRGDGHQHWCKTCFAAYFAARGDRHRKQSGAARDARRARAKAHVLSILRERPCADCGETDPVVLEFDHVGTKTAHVAQLVLDGAKLERIDREIARCEVVCACCHRWRTARRSGSWRLDVATAPAGRRAALQAVRERLATGCVDCGRTDLVVLEFDHLGAKRGSVMVLAWAGYGLETLRREMDVCVVRCCNCHRRRTAAVGRHHRHVAIAGVTPP